MAKGRKTSYFKRNPFLLATLLVIFLLTKIGEIPLAIIKFLISPNAFLVISALVLFSAYSLFLVEIIHIIPSPTRLVSKETPLTTEFYDRNGQLLYRLYEGRNRTLVKLDDLPPYLIQATIAIEDKNFYSHPGFDPTAIARAIYSNHTTKTNQQGASTITQQLVKNSLLTPEKTYQRKIKELLLAFWTERLYSKKEILGMYLNEAPYGGPAWGIEAAAETYFGKSAKDLTLSETAYLTGLPASPTDLSPYGAHPELAMNRRTQVLQRMVEDGYLTEAKAAEALAEPVVIKPNTITIRAPHFVMYLKDLLSQKYGLRVVSQGGLKVYTTLDLGLQENAEQIIKEEVAKLANLNVQNGAAMVINNHGQILAMIGSKDYWNDQFGNYNATTALRAPGSAIKPITYVTAFKLGYTPGSTILDTPVSFPDGKNRYTPVNYDGRFHGPVSIRTALGSSYNIPAVKILATVGLDNVIQTASDMGITTFTELKNYGLSLTLGGAPVKMIDMMEVYETFSNMGERNSVTGILKVTDSSGNVLDEYQNSSKQVLQSEIAYLITNILSDNNARSPAFGANSLLNIPGYQVAVKTGTSDNKRDNWTFGYTPEFTVGVWVGNNDNSPMNQTLTSGITGAAPIWNKIMKGILAKTAPNPFKKPTGIVDVIVDGRKDLAVAGILPKALVRISRDSEKTTFFDAFSAYSTSSAQAKLN